MRNLPAFANVSRILSFLVLCLVINGGNVAAQVIPPRATPPRPAVETDVYLVTFRPGIAAAERAGVVQASGAVLRRSYAVIHAVSVQVPNANALASLRNDPRVLAVVADRPILLHAPQGQGGGPGNGGGGGGNSGGAKPKAPSNLAASTVSSSEISLAWLDNSNNETGFVIERCTGSGCSNFAQVAQTAAAVVTYGDSGLAAATVYRYRAAAINAAGSSKYSNIAEATTSAAPPPPPPPAPNAPGNLVLAVVSYGEIGLTWSDNSSNEEGFRVERCAGTLAACGDSGFQQIAQLAANTTTYSSVGLQPETTYSYRVRAFNSGGNSAYSNGAEATTPASPEGAQVVPAGVERIGAAPGALTWTGAGVGVAVVDTGLDFVHSDLALNPEIVGVNSFNAFGGSCQDIFGHGTHVAGIIAARNNTIDVVGVAPSATVYCVNVFQSDPVYGVVATDESLVAGLDWIAANANSVSPPIRVVNMSLGRAVTPEDNPNHPLHLAVKALYDAGISVVVSAGNDPLSQVSQQVPAGYPEAIAVASTTASNGVNGYDDLFGPCAGYQFLRADTASYFTTDGAFIGGAGVSISAPGETREDIYDYLGTCYLEPIGIESTAMDGGTVELYGTSMAAPHVGGVVALMWEKELSLGLTLSPETVRTRLRSGATRPGTAPLDSPTLEYSFDGEREGVLWAPGALGEDQPVPDLSPTVSILSPANGATFAAGATISFQASATDPEDGNIAASLAWTSSKDGPIGTGATFSRTLSTGNHVITTSLTDSGGNYASSSVSITVGSSSSATTVLVNSILYATQGDNMLIFVNLVNEFGSPVAGASVSALFMEWLYSGQIWTATGTTNTQGTVLFQITSAPFGCYTTEVQSIVATGLTWNGVTPSNYGCK